MKKQSLRNWIKENKEEIDKTIHIIVPEVKINDEERRMWILNDEGLYLWAKHEGVDI